MKIRAEQISQAFNRIYPVYCISGDEPLQMTEIPDQLRAHLKTQGFHEHHRLTLENATDWDDLQAQFQQASLFSEKKLIDVYLKGKPGNAGGRILRKLLESPSANHALLIVTAKLDQATQRSQWFKAIDKQGLVLQVWPIPPQRMPQWLQQRAKQLNLNIDNKAVNLLANATRGNLIAAKHTLEKAQLCYGEGAKLDAAKIETIIHEDATFSVFDLADSMLQGDRNNSLRALKQLQLAGVASPIVLWAIARECRTVARIAATAKLAPDQLDTLYQRLSVWQNRRPLIKQALQRQPLSQWQQWLAQAADIDPMIKGLAPGDPWHALTALVMAITAKPELFAEKVS